MKQQSKLDSILKYALACGVLVLMHSSILAALPSSTYSVTVAEHDPLRVFVDARFETAGDTLYMNPNCPNYDYPEGWSTFIKHLSVRTQSGKEVHQQYHHKSRWSLGERDPGVIHVRYEVDLRFIQEKWDVGNEQAGHYDGEAVYLVSKALFLYPQEDGPSTVTFDLPHNWKLTVPWQSVHPGTFSIPNREYLVENSLVLGRFYDAQLLEGGFDFRIALLGKAQESGDLFSSVLKKVARAYLRIFETTPATIYMITVFHAAMDDGESFYNSNTFTLKDKMDQDNKIIWANQMAHELFHYWSSDLIRADNSAEMQWFSEGTAEYYANLALVREDIIDRELFRSKMEKILGLYQNTRGWRDQETSMLKAGLNKGKNRFLVYNGGWAVALALDVIIREKTGGNRSLNDLMRAMLRKYASTPYRFQDLVGTASDTAGEDLTPFFEKFVMGVELLPLRDFLNKLGYRMLDIIYEGEIYLIPHKHETELGKRWLQSSIN